MKHSLNLVSLRMKELTAESLAAICNRFTSVNSLEVSHGDVDATFLVPGDFEELVIFLYEKAGERPARKVKIYSLSAFSGEAGEFQRLVRTLARAHLRDELRQLRLEIPDSLEDDCA